MLGKILAVDAATRTGWATWDGSRMESGVEDFSKARGESNGMLFIKFNRWLERISFPTAFRPWDLIVWEQAHHRGGAPTEIGVGLSTRLLEFSARINCDHTTVHSASLKKWATGKGNAKKPEMILAACKYKWPHQTPTTALLDDNEADAILLLQYALTEILGETNSCNVLSADPKHASSTP